MQDIRLDKNSFKIVGKTNLEENPQIKRPIQGKKFLKVQIRTKPYEIPTRERIPIMYRCKKNRGLENAT